MFGQGDLRSNLLDVAFWSGGRRGVTCGAAGAFFTEDGGLSWKRIRRHPRKEYGQPGIMYYCVAMGGPREIWLAEGRHPGRGRHLWHSTDAGESWEDAAERFPGPFKSVSDLVVRGDDIWVLAGAHWSFSYRSEDGGTSWEKLVVLPGTRNSHNVASVPRSPSAETLTTVYVLGQGQDREPVLARTDDGGKNWRRINLPSPDDLPGPVWRYRMAFGTADTGMVALPARGLKRVEHGVWETHPGATVSVLLTTDGGASWTRRNLPNRERAPRAIWVDPENPRHALVGVTNGWDKQKGGPREGPALYETFDAGRNWAVAIRGKPQINAICGLDSRRIWAVGNLVGFQANDVVAILVQAGPK
jgi:photosystem II stability/assembly factor-like uncharacterized protein